MRTTRSSRFVGGGWDKNRRSQNYCEYSISLLKEKDFEEPLLFVLGLKYRNEQDG